MTTNEVVPQVPKPEDRRDFADGEEAWCVSMGNLYILRCRVEWWRGDPATYILHYIDHDYSSTSQEDFAGQPYKTEAEARAARQWECYRRYRSELEELQEKDAKGK